MSFYQAVAEENGPEKSARIRAGFCLVPTTSKDLPKADGIVFFDFTPAPQ